MTKLEVNFRDVELVLKMYYRLLQVWAEHAEKVKETVKPPLRLTIDHGENRSKAPFLYVASRDELVWYPRYGADGYKMVQASLRKLRNSFDRTLGSQWFTYDYRFPAVEYGSSVTQYLKRCIDDVCAAFVQRAGGGR